MSVPANHVRTSEKWISVLVSKWSAVFQNTVTYFSAVGLCLLCSKICLLCFLAFLEFFAYYAHFYASEYELC